MRICGALLLVATTASCATAEDHCFVQDPEVARRIGATVLSAEEPSGPNFHVEDHGGHWLVGEWVEDLNTDDEVLLGFGGRSVEIDKCTGQLSNLRRWR